MNNRSKIVIKNIGTNLVLQFVVIISGFIVPKLLISSFWFRYLWISSINYTIFVFNLFT